MLNGLDLSRYQHATPSLAGLSFVWAKATEGTGYIHPMYPIHTAAAAKAGIVHGAYHFGHTGVDPVAQAMFLVAPAPHAQLYALDSEGSTRMSHTEVRAFFAALKAARPGVKAGLYESLSGYDAGLGQDFSWVAAWGSTPCRGTGCAALAAERPQLVVTNLMVASAMLNCLWAVTEQGSVPYSEVYLDVVHNVARSRSWFRVPAGAP
jgi:GH25 family lysozyme M1 (1,4-beta-N-acetylmuramidase)